MTTSSLPQLANGIFLTDGGLETTLVFHEGIDLPHFSAVVLMRSTEGRATLRRYYRRYLDLAREHGHGFILESPTWRASSDWAEPLGMTRADLIALNREAIELMHSLRSEYEAQIRPIVVSGCVGPRGDGYQATAAMALAEAEAYHDGQIAAFVEAGVDVVSAITMTSSAEASGVARAAAARGIPVVISFTVETDGRLPSGETLEAAIAATDAASGGAPDYYMINCAHPTHFATTLDPAAAWTRRLGGLRTNASKRSHAELDAATDLDDGDVAELAAAHAEILARHPQIRVLGGCCGTDHRHVAAIARACAPVAA